jgi:hypothetical protein
MSKCPTCNADDLVLAESRGHIEVYRCRTCGFETWGTVCWGDEIPPQPASVSLSVLWKTGHASAAEIHALRASFPQFRDLSITELLATVGKSPSVQVGVFTRTRAEELGRQAHARGLSIEIVTIDPPS